MKLRTLLLLTAICTTMSFAIGCGNEATNNAGNAPDNALKGDGHGHAGKAVATVEIEGRTVAVSLGSDLEAGKAYPHCHLTITGDPVDAMRVWIGPASGEGALKNLVAELAEHPNVDLKAPADLEGAVLGIEIEVDGEIYTATAELGEGHDEHGGAGGHFHADGTFHEGDHDEDEGHGEHGHEEGDEDHEAHDHAEGDGHDHDEHGHEEGDGHDHDDDHEHENGDHDHDGHSHEEGDHDR